MTVAILKFRSAKNEISCSNLKRTFLLYKNLSIMISQKKNNQSKQPIRTNFKKEKIFTGLYNNFYFNKSIVRMI